MVPSRALLFLVAALALPLSVFSGCSDSGSKGDDSADDDSSDGDEDDDNAGEQDPDARVRTMDGSVRNDASTGNAMDGASASEDAGEQADASQPPQPDATVPVDAGSNEDAAVEGMDAATDAGGGDAKADATADATVVDSGEDEEDAAEPEEDAAVADADAGKPDTGTADAGAGLDEDDCTENDGVVKDADEECATGETTYELIDDKICCVPGEPPAPGGACGGSPSVACPQGQFCDTSKLGGGDGCTVTNAKGKCRAVPEMCSPGVFAPGCGCDGMIYVDVCAAYIKSVPAESCLQ